MDAPVDEKGRRTERERESEDCTRIVAILRTDFLA
jgi:hypothetical protein